MKWTIGRKMGLAPLVILLSIVIATAISAYYGLRVLNSNEAVVEEQYPSMKALDRMTMLLYEKRIVYEQYFVSKDEALLARLNRIQSDYDQNLLSFITLPLSQDEWEIINRFTPINNTYFAELENAVSFFQSNPAKLIETLDLVANSDKILTEQIIPLIQELHLYKEAVTNSSIEELKFSVRADFIGSLIPLILSIIIGAVLSYFLGRSMTRSIVSLTETAEAISLGDFSRSITATTKDEIGDLAHAVERMRMSLEKAMDRLRKRK